MAEEESASEAAAKVQEVAANVRQAASRRKRPAGSEAETVARRYFEAIDAHDVDGAAAMWAPDGRENVRGPGRRARAGGRARVHRRAASEAMPDLSMQVLSHDDRG